MLSPQEALHLFSQHTLGRWPHIYGEPGMRTEGEFRYLFIPCRQPWQATNGPRLIMDSASRPWSPISPIQTASCLWLGYHGTKRLAKVHSYNMHMHMHCTHSAVPEAAREI